MWKLSSCEGENGIFKKGKTMRILIYKWKAYNYKDIYHTFLSMGHRVDVLEYPLESYDKDETFMRLLKGKLKETTYDFVFTINYFALIATVCQQEKIKYVSWSCDAPLISMYHASVFSKYNYIFLFDKANYLEFRARGVKNIFYLPLCVDSVRISHLLEQAKDLIAYENEISFVGSLYERNTYDKLEPLFSPHLKGYLEAVMQAQRSVSGGNIVEEMLTVEILEEIEKYFQLEKSKESFSNLSLIFSTTVLGFKIAQIQRKKALIELSKYAPVSIYTNSNTADLLRIIKKGSVDYWSQMPKVFYKSKINLNYTIPNIKSGIPLRVWDILGAQGFLLTNYQAEIPDFFEDGIDLVCFDGVKDMVEKARYYLNHDKQREEIAMHGYQKVRTYHTYYHRIEEMLRIIKNA